MSTAKEILVAFSLKFGGDWDQIYSCISNKSECPKYDGGNKNFVNYITILDDIYDSCLKQSYKCPFVLYYSGDINLISENNYKHRLSISGSRKCMLSYEVLENIISNLPKDTIVVTGGALGTDTAAIKYALDNELKVIVVLPCGLDNLYPTSNAKLLNKVVENGGLLITEYPSEISASQEKFLSRDRIIAALSPKLLITEVHERSGTMATVSLALSNGKDIYVIPTTPTEGIANNSLIKEGALLVETAEDLCHSEE